MILAIDIGNTNIFIGAIDNKKTYFVERITTTIEMCIRDSNLPGEVGGINCAGDMGVRRRLARSLTSLALRCALQKRERSP